MMMNCSSDHVVRVKREKLEACMTCPICDDLYREATTISECLHTFCKKCIYDKITNDDCDRCPVCKTDLGVAPMEKLRADNSLEEIRAKLFPSESKNDKARVLESDEQVVGSENVFYSTKAPENGLPSIFSSGRKNQRCLSSFGTSKATVITELSPSGQQYFTRKNSALHESHLSTEEDHLPNNNGYFPEKYATYTRQNATEKLFKKPEVNNGIMNKAQPRWTTGPMEAKRVPRERAFFNLNDAPAEINTYKEHDSNNESTHATSVLLPTVEHGHKRKVLPEQEKLQTPSERMVLVDANKDIEQRVIPIWFLLQAYPWEGYAPLPQIPSSYLRVKDGNLPSSFIKKYLVKKLNLQSEGEVEILIRGKSIHPSLLLRDLVELWSEKIPALKDTEATAGSSAKEYVMVITYCRKLHPRW